MIVNDRFNFCWLCGDDVEDMEEVELAPDVTMWLCSKHAKMRGRTEEREFREQLGKEAAAWDEWMRISLLDIGITRKVVNGVTFIHRS